MHKLKNLALTIVATVMLVGAPSAQAQEPENLAIMQTFLAIVKDYFEVINATHGVASDPEKAAIMQMQKIQEAYEARGEKAKSVQVLMSVLESSNNPAIRNAVYIMIGDTLKETGRTDEAIRMLRQGLEENIQKAE